MDSSTPHPSLSQVIFEGRLCFWEDVSQSHRLRAFSSKCLSAGSEEDLDEEGLGRRAVTPQVTGNDGG